MQFFKTRFARQKEGPPGGNPNGPKMNWNNESFTSADSVLQQQEST
jgi:hypothetical protein